MPSKECCWYPTGVASRALSSSIRAPPRDTQLEAEGWRIRSIAVCMQCIDAGMAPTNQRAALSGGSPGADPTEHHLPFALGGQPLTPILRVGMRTPSVGFDSVSPDGEAEDAIR